MKISVKLAFATLVVCTQQSFSQVEDHRPSQYSISLGMGVGVHSAPSLADYISAFGTSGDGERVDEFSSMLELYVTPSMRVEREWDVAIEYGLLLKTHLVGSNNTSSGTEFAYSVHMPTAIVHYVVDGESYYVKLGGGAGYHFATMTRTLFVFGSEEKFSTAGFGAKLEAVGNTKFDDTFYGNIVADLRWDFLDSFKKCCGCCRIR
ncbi:MAG: hypothetical protein L0Y80_05630 [Ignavibacteriae bacterium]|nr:hypothetical protein [Ignavibacteriota bacterium]